MNDLFDNLTTLRDRLDTLMAEEQVRANRLERVRAKKREAEIKEIELHLVLAIALQALNRATPYVRHPGPRQQITGAKETIKKVLAA